MKRVAAKPGVATPDEALSASDSTYYVSLSDHIKRTRTTSQDEGFLLSSILPEQYTGSVWSLEALAIPMTYMSTGLMYSFPQANIEYFPRTLGASDAQLSTVAVRHRLIDDCVVHAAAVGGYGWCRYGRRDGRCVGGASSSTAAAKIAEEVDGGEATAGRRVQNESAARGDATADHGSEWGWGASMGQQFAFLAFIPMITVLPSLRYFYEPTEENGPMPLEEQVAGIWLMLQRRATWQPVCFLVLANALFVQNAAWGNFLKVAYDFSAFEYGALSGIGATVTFASIVVYRLHILPRYEAPWHDVYFVTGLVVAGFSLLNVLLVFQVNETFGIPPFWFAMGDAAGESFARGFQYLPVAQMFVAVCPEQQEGVAFALLTSVTNLAQAFANTISNMLLHIWPVELKDLQRQPHDFSGVWKLSVLTSIIPLVPVVFLTTRLLPKGPRQLEEMRHQLSPTGAAIVVGLYGFGFVWVIVLSMLAIFSPCHVLVGGHGCQ
ncbi:hypothetical protein ON010_g151 [Phytophthora cinnamomi]|nr:hypothetical protein ON010_g151 [Phytophthora cinnamomi]